MKQEIKKDNSGMTLAEMIVTFALMGIFLAAVVTVITSSVTVHSELTGTMYAQSVGETLLDKITGELSAAKAAGGKSIVIGDMSEYGATTGNGVSFYDREGVHSAFFIKDGLLVMQAGDNEWKMEGKAYMGYRITDLQISRLNNENILEIQLILKNLKNGFEYSASKSLECYNFRTEEDFKRISE